MIKSQEGTIGFSHLPPEIRESGAPATAHRPGRKPKLQPDVVADALRRAGGNKAQAARLLAVSRTTLYRYLDAQ
jgi:transcriptional regulator of acetoin/glycerol metabolism